MTVPWECTTCSKCETSHSYKESVTTGRCSATQKLPRRLSDELARITHEDVKAWYTELASISRLYLGHAGWRPAEVDHARKLTPGAAICRPDPPGAVAPESGTHAWLPCHPTGGLVPAAAPTLSWLSSGASSPAALQPHMPLCQQALDMDDVTRLAQGTKDQQGRSLFQAETT